MLTDEEKYQAILRRDSSYEGTFYTCVKTTKIFCRPTCTAKKPKKENVLFLDTAKEALQHGFRPCKLCKPLEVSGNVPVEIQQLIQEIIENTSNKIKDYQLRERGLDPVAIRRWFKKNHDITFHGFQRMVRINSAFSRIAHGETITNSAFDAGYDSLSGFNESFKSVFGNSPSKNKKTVIQITRFVSKLGPMYSCATDQGICLLEFTDRRMLETEFKDLCRLMDAVILPGSNRFLTQVQTEIDEYFEGKRKTFDVPLHMPGSSFQQSVWKLLKEIPYGKTVSYKDQAIKLGNINAVRAVAKANGYNRISIIVPCHRVIGEDGNLTGYGGGLNRKKWLLEFEKKNSGPHYQTELTFEKNQLT